MRCVSGRNGTVLHYTLSWGKSFLYSSPEAGLPWGFPRVWRPITYHSSLVAFLWLGLERAQHFRAGVPGHGQPGRRLEHLDGFARALADDAVGRADFIAALGQELL